jgi:hypothetical protein
MNREGEGGCLRRVLARGPCESIQQWRAVDEGVPAHIEKAIEELFAKFGLDLKVIVFWQEPQVPLKVLKGQ